MRRLHVKPSWLDDLLCAWAARQEADITRGLGHARICPMFKQRVGRSGYVSSEPFGISLTDISDVGFEISELADKYRLAIYMHYLPWTRRTMQQQIAVYAVSTETWRLWCHEAAKILAPQLERRTDHLSNFGG